MRVKISIVVMMLICAGAPGVRRADIVAVLEPNIPAIVGPGSYRFNFAPDGGAAYRSGISAQKPLAIIESKTVGCDLATMESEDVGRLTPT
jgi:hypothetical protein